MANKRFALPLIAACLATTCLGYGAFASNPSLYFYPAQKWTVSQSGGSPEAPSCALSNKFNNGFGININGTSAGLDTLDIDFRQASFEQGKRYEIVFTVPGQAREVVQATARTRSVLSSDISSRTEFSQTLESAATLDLGIQGNEFRLYLTGLAKGLEEYQDCIAPPPAISAGIDEVENPPELAVASAPEIEAIVPGPAIEDEPIIEEPIVTASAPIAVPVETEIQAPSDKFLSESPVLPEPAAAPTTPDPLQDIVKPTAASNIPADKGDIVAKASSLADSYEATRKPAAQAPEPFFPDESSSANNDAFFDSEAIAVEPAAVSEPAPLPQEAQSASRQPANGPSGDVLKTEDDVIFFGAPPPAKSNSKQDSAVQAPDKQASAEIDAIVTAPEPAPKPVHKTSSLPAYKLNKATASLEADLTRAGLPEDGVAAASVAPAAGPDTEQDEARMQNIAMASAALEPSSGYAGDDFIQMRDKIRELESEVSRLSKENANLDNELTSSLKDSEQERLSVSSDNWNLERATMRYNEAERQIKRLGRQLQTARQQCTQEKQQLEGMLFDPQVTEQQQLAKLSALEQQLAKAKVELQGAQRRYEERIRLLEAQLGAQ